jgi:hypothetical protein
MIACAHCRTAMPTPTGRASRKRYCNDDCRKAAWRARHRNDAVHGDVVPAVPGVLTVPTAFTDDVPVRGGQHRCPHCRTPLAIISIVIPADAAIIRPPEMPLTTHNSANLNPSPGEDDLATLGNFGERQHHSLGRTVEVALQLLGPLLSAALRTRETVNRLDILLATEHVYSRDDAPLNRAFTGANDPVRRLRAGTDVDIADMDEVQPRSSICPITSRIA